MTALTFPSIPFVQLWLPFILSMPFYSRVCNGRIGFGSGVENRIKLPHGHSYVPLPFSLCPKDLIVPFWQNITKLDQLVRNVYSYSFSPLPFSLLSRENKEIMQTTILLPFPVFLFLLAVIITTAIYCMAVELRFESKSAGL